MLLALVVTNRHDITVLPKRNRSPLGFMGILRTPSCRRPHPFVAAPVVGSSQVRNLARSCGSTMTESETERHTAGNDRKYREDASILLAAQDESQRYDIHAPSGGIMSVPAMNEEQAVELAADEYPDHGIEDFEPVTDFCDHGRPMKAGCLKCDRTWGEQ